MADDEKCVQVGSFVWKWHESVGWYDADEDDPAWDTEIALLDEIVRLRAAVQHVRVALLLAVEELFTHRQYDALTHEMLFNQFLDEARRG